VSEKTVKVKLASARIGHSFDAKGRQIGDFAQSVGDIVDMPESEAKRYVDKGLASYVNKGN
jgi:hypothetical protein